MPIKQKDITVYRKFGSCFICRRRISFINFSCRQQFDEFLGDESLDAIGRDVSSLVDLEFNDILRGEQIISGAQYFESAQF